MFLIFNFILYSQGTSSKSPVFIADTSETYVTRELITALNEIRSKKKLNSDEILFYDKLIKKGQKLYECQKNLGSKILQLSEIITENRNNRVLVANPLETESFCLSVYLGFIDIFILEMKQDKLLFEFEEFMKQPFSEVIFSNYENQILNQVLLNIHVTIKNASNFILNAFINFDGYSDITDSEIPGVFASNP